MLCYICIILYYYIIFIKVVFTLLTNSPCSHALAFSSSLVVTRKDWEFSGRSDPCLSLVGENACLTSSCIQQPLPLKWILLMKAVGAA